MDGPLAEILEANFEQKAPINYPKNSIIYQKTLTKSEKTHVGGILMLRVFPKMHKNKPEEKHL